MSKKINERVMLAMLNISIWSARKFDNKATVDVEASNGVSNVGRFNKRLIPEKAPEYKRLTEISTKLRSYFYSKSLPYGQEGIRLLPAKVYMEVAAEVRKASAEYEQAIADFIDSMEAQKAEAKVQLQSLYLESDYPNEETLRSKFGIYFKVLPFPDAEQFGVELPEEVIDSIKSSINDQVEETTTLAMNDLWKRLYEAVSHMADKLAVPDAIFRDSMIQNVHEVVELLPKLNFIDDPDLNSFCDQVGEKLAKVAPMEMRTDTAARADTAGEAIAIQNLMASFMGLPPTTTTVKTSPQQLLIVE